MKSETLIPREVPPKMVEPNTYRAPYVDWAAIFAGSAFALAVSFVLITFGSSLGLSLSSPYEGEGMSASWLAIAAGIWFVWVMINAFGVGGYLAGRMRRRAGDATQGEVEVRDGTHGLMVWATGVLVSTVLAATGAGSLLIAGTAAVGTATEIATEAASSDYFANLMLRGGTISAPQAEQSDAGTSAADDAETAVTSGRQPARQTTSAVSVEPAVQQQIASIIARSAASGELAERDRSYLAQLVAANSDLDETAARARVDEVTAEIDNARAAVLAAAEKARVAGVIIGFIVAATLLISAAVAFFAAAAGGRHRDEGLGLDVFTLRR
jgi:hypothetical protein